MPAFVCGRFSDTRRVRRGRDHRHSVAATPPEARGEKKSGKSIDPVGKIADLGGAARCDGGRRLVCARSLVRALVLRQRRGVRPPAYNVYIYGRGEVRR